MDHKKAEPNNLIVAGCSGCAVLFVGMIILVGWFAFYRGTSPSQKRPPDSTSSSRIDPAFSGQHSSLQRRTKYELDAEAKRFVFYVSVGARFMPQAEIYPCVFSTDESGSVVNIFGTDNQAGGSPRTQFKITRVASKSFHLERIQPVGGDLGVFQ